MLLIGVAAQAQEDLQFEHRLNGPYPEDDTKYLIRVIFNFMDGESSDGNWWSVMGYDPAVEAQAGLDNLNGAFNEHGIYFLPYGAGYCEGAAYYNTVTEADLPTDVSIEQSLKMSRAFYQPQDEIDHALNIYVLPPLDSPAITGDAHLIPNNYAWVKGYDTIEGLATSSTTLPHEVGHALGLLHPHAANLTWECDEESPGVEDLENCQPPVSISYCCGDFVDDTPYYTFSSFVNVGVNCDAPDQAIPEILIENYMSYITPATCRDEFLGEQAGRMKKYLRELHAPANGSVNLLKDIQYLSVYPGEVPSGLTGNFNVESGTCTFNDALETHPPFFKKVYGVYIRGLSDGFEVVENDFTNLHFNTAVYIPHGTYCDGTGAGLGNLIGHNTYFGMLTGNEAQGQNGDMDNGLLYVCNNHDPELPGLQSGGFSDEVIDYKIGGSIRNPQSGISENPENNLPTGNVFSPPSDPEIENTSGITFQYYYDGNFSNQAPNSSTGIELEGLIDILPEEYCTAASCPPPCKEGPIAIKERFQERGHLQDSLKTLLANGGSPAYLEEITKRLQASRWQKDKAAGTIIRYYAQDTLKWIYPCLQVFTYLRYSLRLIERLSGKKSSFNNRLLCMQ